MVIKRYVVKDMPEAVVLIRKELGKDAVILSTKRVRVKRWFGLWRQSRIEVLAAVGKDVPVRSFDIPFTRTNRGIEPGVTTTVEATAAGAERATNGPVVPKVEVAEGHGSLGNSSKATTNEGSQSPASNLPADATESMQTAAIQADLVKMREEIAGLKEVLESSWKTDRLPAGWGKAIERLTRQGVSKELVETWMVDGAPARYAALSVSETAAAAMEGWPVPFSPDALLEMKIREKLAEITSVQPIALTSRLVMFVGPTGVGKTTTIAKVAALQVLAGKRKVGLITTDTFRIAAVDQLRTYANILGVPLEVVSRPEEMTSALERLKDRDLILIDTAGRNFEVSEHLERIQRLLGVAPVDEVYLVLSLTAKPEDMSRVVEQFAQIPVHKFLFTKLDETQSYGAILNLLLTYQKPLSYLTTGQNVPNDIEIASLEKVVKLVLSEVAV